jgi:crotonobetainyl-CoA:carnitine CoA-transferase CaiB-like acyl-CoA transferase
MASEATASLGRIGEPPVRAGTDMAGMFAGIHAVQAVAAALIAREADGKGDRIDVSLFGSLVTMRSTLWVALSNPDEWWGFHLDSYVKPPFHGFQCRDGRIYFELRGFTAAQREALLEELGMNWAREDARYEQLLADAAGGSGRYTHELMGIWDSGLREWTCAEAIEIIERHHGVALPMNDYSALLAAEQVKHLGIVRSGQGPDEAEIPYIRSPWFFESAG